MQKAKVVSTKIDSQNSRLALRSGAKGTGKVLWSCTYWHDSPPAVNGAYERARDAAELAGVEIVSYPHND